MDPVISLASFDVGPLLGSGGQADVFETKKPYVFKKYHHPELVDSAALDALVSAPTRLSPLEMSELLEVAAWPMARVIDGNQTVGILMLRASPQWLTTLRSGKSVLRELQFAILADRARKLGVVLPDPSQRAALVRSFARSIQLMSNCNVAHGDLSMRNILWQAKKSPSIYLLDCDGSAVNGKRALPHVGTPHWIDPRVSKGKTTAPDHESDLYALGLVFLRVYYQIRGNIELTTSNLQTPHYPPLPNSTAQLLGRSLSQRDERPTAGEWIREMTALHDALIDPTTDLHDQLIERAKSHQTDDAKKGSVGSAPLLGATKPEPAPTPEVTPPADRPKTAKPSPAAAQQAAKPEKHKVKIFGRRFTRRELVALALILLIFMTIGFINLGG